MQTYYERLASDEQRQAYNVVKSALERKSPYANVRCGIGGDKAYIAVLMDNPLCCVSHPWIDCRYDGRNYALQYIQINEDLFIQKLNAVENEVQKNYGKNKGANQFELYKAIFDVLSRRIEFDFETENDYIRLLENNPSQREIDKFLKKHGEVFSPYGALINKKSVCNGIAKLFQIVCHRFGLPCSCVQARGIRGEKNPPTEIPDNTLCDHLLNVIEINGQQAFVDLANGLVTKDIPMTIYDYFVINYETLRKSYLLRPCDLQQFHCNSVDNMYFEMNNLIVSSLSTFRRRLSNYISHFNKGEIRIYYRGNKLDDDKLSKIFDEIVTFHCPATKCMSEKSCYNGFCNCAIIDR